VDNCCKTFSCGSKGGVLQDLQTTLGITEGKDRTASDMLIDANWLSCFIINKVELLTSVML